MENIGEKESMFSGGLFIGAVIFILIYGIALILPNSGTIGLIKVFIEGICFLGISVISLVTTLKKGKDSIYNEKKKSFEFVIKKFVKCVVIALLTLIASIPLGIMGIEQVRNSSLDLINKDIKTVEFNIIRLNVKYNPRSLNTYTMVADSFNERTSEEFQLSKKQYKSFKNNKIESNRKVKISFYKRSNIICDVEY